MTLITYHILRNLALGLIFPTLILVGGVWLTHSLRYVKVIVNHNVSFGEYLTLVSFLLPDLFSLILPIGALISVIIVYNKLMNDHELVILRASGLNNWRIARPALILGAAITAFVLFCNAFVSPASMRYFRDINHHMKTQFTTAFIQEGRFNTLRGVTVYTRERDIKGHLKDIIIYNKGEVQNGKKKPPYVVLAEEGFIQPTPRGATLVLLKGSRQERDPEANTISFFNFDQFHFDLGELNQGKSQRQPKIYEMSLPDLFSTASAATGKTEKQILAEAHTRIMSPLLTILYILIACAILLRGEYTRVARKRRTVYTITACTVSYLAIFALVNSPRSWTTAIAYFLFLAATFCATRFLESKPAGEKVK